LKHHLRIAIIEYMNNLAKRVGIASLAGAIIAIPLPFIGPVLGAIVGAVIGVKTAPRY
jgi:hypothetical protein